MARNPRIEAAHEWHHAMNRGARREDIYRDADDRRAFLDLLERTLDRYNAEVHAYVLMGNHYHIALQCPDQNLSDVMKYLGGQYAQYFNRRHGLDGPLFRGRYHNVPVRSDAQLISLVAYIHRNPVDIGEVNLAEYRWSSYSAYLGRYRTPSFLQTSFVRDLIGSDTRALLAPSHDLNADAA